MCWRSYQSPAALRQNEKTHQAVRRVFLFVFCTSFSLFSASSSDLLITVCCKYFYSSILCNCNYYEIEPLSSVTQTTGSRWMQSTITGNIENQITSTVQKRTPEQDQKPAVSVANPQKGKPIKLPDDIVNLSVTSFSKSSESKKPSTPVTMAEKESLLNNSFDNTCFSINA